MKESRGDEDDPQDLDANAKYRAPALEKGLDILRLLAGERTPMTVSTICQRLDRSQGEIFRMVQDRKSVV